MYKNISKKLFSSISFAIVGSGPAGLYTAKHLLKKYANIKIDFFEKLPHPYGLIRTGVAPDHQEVKNVEKDFHQIIEDSRVRFLGNVEVGKNGDITFDTLRNNYSSIILSYGAASENKLDLKNENEFGSFSARNFVNWYNGHIFYSPNSEFLGNNTKFRFEEANDVVIIGNGNVAIDVARILAKDVDSLRKYDIPESVLDVLSRSKIKNIHVVARRGVIQSAFTIKEMRELSKIDGCKMYVFKEELEKSLNEDSMEEVNSMSVTDKRQITRKLDLIKTFNKLERNSTIPSDSRRNIILRFMLSPSEINMDANGLISGMVFNKTIFKGKPTKLIELPDEKETINCPVIFKSIGYKSLPIFDDIYFDNKKYIVKNDRGVAYESTGDISNNIFTVGWVKTGPKGIVDSTLRDSYDTTESIINAIEENKIKEKTPNYDYIVSNIRNKGKIPFTYEDWKKVDIFEIEEGKKKNKLREKIIDINKMISIVQN
jgi:NADPH-dependent glutamate synthase beta subunit-like oxidoreductase